MFDKAWKVITGAAALLLLVVGVWYLATREHPREMHPLLLQVAEETAGQFADTIPRSRNMESVLLIVAGRGPRDEEVQLRKLIERHINKSPKYRYKTWSDIEGLMSENVIAQLQQKVGLLEKQPPHTLQKAIDTLGYLDLANIQVDGLLYVDVEDFSEGEEGLGARITLEGTIWSVKEKKKVDQVPEITRAIESSWDHRYLSFKISESSLIVRALAWFAASAAIPWIAIGVVRWVVKRRHNPLNLAMLIGFTALDLVLAFVLLCALTVGPGSLVLLMLVAAAMGYYNYDACDYIERRLQ